jgi:hypothetical protein
VTEKREQKERMKKTMHLKGKEGSWLVCLCACVIRYFLFLSSFVGPSCREGGWIHARIAAKGGGRKWIYFSFSLFVLFVCLFVFRLWFRLRAHFFFSISLQ